MKRALFLMGVLAILLAACGQTPPEPTPTPTQPAATAMPSATAPPAITPTPTLSQVTVQLTTERVNCRMGPGTVYELVNEISQGRSLRAIGRNDASNWWYVRDPGNPNGSCWVSADVTETQGEAEQLPIIPPPFVTVTKVDLRVEPNRILVGCSQFPQTVFFEAQVTTDGPTLLTWKWEVSNGAVSDVGTLVYERAGTQVINEYYRINGPNDYWVKLYILTPNERVEQVTFPVNCTP
jgi:SH3-like domain-containing protein